MSRRRLAWAHPAETGWRPHHGPSTSSDALRSLGGGISGGSFEADNKGFYCLDCEWTDAWKTWSPALWANGEVGVEGVLSGDGVEGGGLHLRVFLGLAKFLGGVATITPTPTPSLKLPEDPTALPYAGIALGYAFAP